MLLHVREYKKRIARDLQNMVREGSLGQNCWDRLPGETPQQHHRFLAYLTHRSVDRVAKICNVDVGLIKGVASRWQWRFRSIAYDDYLAKKDLAAYETEKKRSAVRQARLGQRLQNAALVGASQLISRVENGDVEISGNEVAKLADIGVKIERLANSDPTAIKEDRGIHFVWEGPRPSWAPPDPAAFPEPRQIEATLIDDGATSNA